MGHSVYQLVASFYTKGFLFQDAQSQQQPLPQYNAPQNAGPIAQPLQVAAIPTTTESTFEKWAKVPEIIAQAVAQGKTAVQTLEILQSDGYDIPNWVKVLVEVFSL